jgi:hypothetical protein
MVNGSAKQQAGKRIETTATQRSKVFTEARLYSPSGAPSIAFGAQRISLQRMRSGVNDMISATQRMAYTRRSNGQAFKPRIQENFVAAAVSAALLHSSFILETHSLPTLARRYPRGFTFYVAYPIHSILNSYFPSVSIA